MHREVSLILFKLSDPCKETLTSNLGPSCLKRRLFDELLQVPLIKIQTFKLLSQVLLLLPQSVDLELKFLAEFELTIDCVLLLALCIRTIFA